MDEWTYLAEGTYNKVYHNQDKTKVLKIRKKEDDRGTFDAPDRSVRLWNLINKPPIKPAYIINSKFGVGWVAPYIEGEQASDEDIQQGLINVFNDCGRVVIDGIAPKNFVKTRSGQIVCIDIGMAVEIEARQEKSLGGRRASEISLNIWHRMAKPFIDYFQKFRNIYPNSVEAIKALMFIQANRPDIFDVSFLRSDLSKVTRLARAYDQQWANRDVQNIANNLHGEDVRDAMDELSQERAITLSHIKESCVLALNRYISSRGLINQRNRFEASFITSNFRNEELTAFKVDSARQLIRQINAADSFEYIQDLLDEARQNTKIIESHYTWSGLASCLGRCQLNLEVARESAGVNLQSGQDQQPG